MSDNIVIYSGKMASWEKHDEPRFDVEIQLLGNSRIVAFIKDADGNTREAAIEIGGENGEELLLMTHPTYNPADPEKNYADEPNFLAKVRDDRAFAYNAVSGQNGLKGATYAMLSEEGIELTDALEFAEPTAAPTLK